MTKFSKDLSSEFGSEGTTSGSAIPPNADQRFYDEKGNFKSTFSEGKVPERYITQGSMFSDSSKLRQDITYRLDKLADLQEEERAEFKKHFDIYGKDKIAYEKLKREQETAMDLARNRNEVILKEFRRENEENRDKGLR